MDHMIAAEMCEVLNPMLALNKLTVYSHARPGTTHAVTDEVIAADTTKYRNPLDRVLPDQDKTMPRIDSLGVDEDVNDKTLDRIEYLKEEDDDKVSLLPSKDCLWEAGNHKEDEEERVERPPIPEHCQKPQSVQKMDQHHEISSLPTAKEERDRTERERSETLKVVIPATSNTAPTPSPREKREGSREKAPHRANAAPAASASKDAVSKASAPATAGTTGKDSISTAVSSPTTLGILLALSQDPSLTAARYNKPRRDTSPRHARPPIVPMVPEAPTFRNAFCCGVSTRMMPVSGSRSSASVSVPTRHPRSPRPKDSGGMKAAGDATLHQNQQHTLEVPEVSADMKTSSSSSAASSQAASPSAVLLPVLPPIPGRKAPSPVDYLVSPPPNMQRQSSRLSSYCRGSDAPPAAASHEPQSGEVRQLFSPFSSISSSSPNSFEDCSRHFVSTKTPPTVKKQPVGRRQITTASTTSTMTKTATPPPKASWRRTKAPKAVTQTPPAGTATNISRRIRKTSVGGGKRSLSPTKSPEEIKRAAAVSSTNLAPLPGKVPGDQLSGAIMSPITKILRKHAIRERPAFYGRSKEETDFAAE